MQHEAKDNPGDDPKGLNPAPDAQQGPGMDVETTAAVPAPPAPALPALPPLLPLNWTKATLEEAQAYVGRIQGRYVMSLGLGNPLQPPFAPLFYPSQPPSPFFLISPSLQFTHKSGGSSPSHGPPEACL